MPPMLLQRLAIATLAFLSSGAAARALEISNVTELDAPIVDLGYAEYEGTTLPGGVNQFLGMRYAEPPTGGLRWKEPQDPTEENTGLSSAKDVS